MIRVRRGEPPVGFAERSQGWRERFDADRVENPQLRISVFWTRVRPQMTREAAQLYNDFHGKCAYCESKIGHVSPAHIEHYRPKARFPERVFSWENWLLSCGRCNDKKWAHFPGCGQQPCLIDPTEEEPSQHIEFEGYTCLALSQRGEETIRLVGLDRSPLEEERSIWLSYLNALLIVCLRVPDLAAEARGLLIWAMQNDAPYSAMTRCYLAKKTPRLANPAQPHPEIQLQNAITRMQELVNEVPALLLQNLV